MAERVNFALMPHLGFAGNQSLRPNVNSPDQLAPGRASPH